jgi:cytochrome c
MTYSVIKTAATAAALLLVLSPAAALSADGEKLYQTKTCFTCHGKDGKTPIMPMYPKIAGQNQAYTLQQLKDIKSGARSNGQSAAMKGVMGLVSDDEMKSLSEYIATMKP